MKSNASFRLNNVINITKVMPVTFQCMYMVFRSFLVSNVFIYVHPLAVYSFMNTYVAPFLTSQPSPHLSVCVPVF